jgi:hypothetical protein
MTARIFVLAFVVGCAAKPITPTAPPVPAQAPVELGDWRPLSFGAYLAPKVLPHEPMTVLWHFHACRAAEKDYRSLGMNVVIVCLDNLGIGTAPYWNAFNDPTRFGRMRDEVAAALPELRVGKLVLVAWSAGYASVQQILNVSKYYDETNAVVLLDGLHAGYTKNADGTPTKIPNLDTVSSILRFAQDAAAGKKAFVFTHSGVIPPGYASTTEMAHALAERLKMAPSATDSDFPTTTFAADSGNAHVRGFDGGLAKDHIAQLHLVMPVLRKWVLNP